MGTGKKYPALKVPRQCPLVLLAEAYLNNKGKYLGSEEGK
jgi:hypothetical protein